MTFSRAVLTSALQTDEPPEAGERDTPLAVASGLIPQNRSARAEILPVMVIGLTGAVLLGGGAYLWASPRPPASLQEPVLREPVDRKSVV